ncbi:MAG TPA: hypothetical protein VKB78_07715 [Pirellulales bacterium]|nr:hypothetical protein [Pirellulales bacterium]
MSPKASEQQAEREDILPAVSNAASALPMLERAAIDSQIATARQYPRNVKTASDDIMYLATLDEQTAAEMMYALPRGNKPIRGPSVRLAEIIMQCWGNCRVTAQVIEIDRANKIVTAEGTFHDLQTNAAIKAVVNRRISDKQGRIYGDDMIVTTGNAACAIARRNATLVGVPKAIWRRAYEAAEHRVAGDIKTLATRREAAVKAFAQYGVKPEQIFAAIGVKALEDITLDHMPTLTGMYQTLRSGEETVETMFDPRRGGRSFEAVENPLKDDDAGGNAGGKKNTASKKIDAKADAKVDAKAADQAAAAGPKTADEYKAFARSVIDEATNKAELEAWFTSEAQRNLRSKCGIDFAALDLMKSWIAEKP